MLEIDIVMPPDIQNEVQMLPSSHCRWQILSVIILLRNWMRWQIQLPSVSDKETEGKFFRLLYTVDNKDCRIVVSFLLIYLLFPLILCILEGLVMF